MKKRRPSYEQEPSDDENGRTPAESAEAWAGRYLDLIQRNWTAWLESTPEMFKAALEAAERADGLARAKAGLHEDEGRSGDDEH